MARWFERNNHNTPAKNAAEGSIESPQQQSSKNNEESQTNNSSNGAPEVSPGPLGLMRRRLQKTRRAMMGQIDRLVLGKKKIDEDVLEELEEILITSDLGVLTTQKLIAAMQQRLHRKELTDVDRLLIHLKDEIHRLLKVDAQALNISSHQPFVILTIGVNGVGKTTTLAKMAHNYKKKGYRSMLVAADTFRAAAVDQLERWAERIGADLVKQRRGADPAAVVYDAMSAAKTREVDVVLIDTAGRLHTKVNLMEELKKIKRVIVDQMDTAPHEILLILDATTGQNAISQTRLFHQELEVSGLALTKLDGTAKGGIVVGVSQEFQIPIRYIGLGEGLEDLREFDPEQFVAALF